MSPKNENWFFPFKIYVEYALTNEIQNYINLKIKYIIFKFFMIIRMISYLIYIIFKVQTIIIKNKKFKK